MGKLLETLQAGGTSTCAALMLLALLAWAVAAHLVHAGFGCLRKRTAHKRLAPPLARYSLIRLDTAAFLVRWAMVFGLLSLEACLGLRLLRSSYPAFYEPNIPALRLWLGHAKALGVIVLCFAAMQRLARLLYEAVLARTHSQKDSSSPEERLARVHTLLNVMRGVITSILAVGAALAILAEFDTLRLLAPLLTGAGLAGIAVAFAVQSLLRDFFAGFFILLENHYRIGDMVKIADRSGTVQAISLRTTVLRDENGAVHIIPNGEIKTLSNMSVGWASAPVDISLPPAYPPDQVIGALGRAAQRLADDPKLKDSLLAPPAVLGIDSLFPTAAVYRTLLRCKPQSQSLLAREFRRYAYYALAQEGLGPAATDEKHASQPLNA